MFVFFFFKQKTAYEIKECDWSSDVCSSDLLKYKALNFKERLKVIKLMLKLPFISHRSLVKKNVFEWLTDENQSEKIINSFWEMIAVGALNTNINKASAAVFHNILVQMFYGGNIASTIILPKYGLTESYVNNAKDYIEQQGGEIILSDKVEKIVIDQNEVKEIKTAKRIYSDFDFVISALPPYSIEKLIPSGYLNGEINFTYSSILNVHIWLKKNPFNEKFYGLLNSPVHWIFNKGTLINLVISNAGYLMDKTDNELLNVCTTELNKYCNIDENEITDFKILKEKRATFIPSVDSVYTRPPSRTEINNLFLAGDWTDTGLPSTIESAAKSGRVASELALGNIQT